MLREVSCFLQLQKNGESDMGSESEEKKENRKQSILSYKYRQ